MPRHSSRNFRRGTVYLCHLLWTAPSFVTGCDSPVITQQDRDLGWQLTRQLEADAVTLAYETAATGGCSVSPSPLASGVPRGSACTLAAQTGGAAASLPSPAPSRSLSRRQPSLFSEQFTPKDGDATWPVFLTGPSAWFLPFPQPGSGPFLSWLCRDPSQVSGPHELPLRPHHLSP